MKRKSHATLQPSHDNVISVKKEPFIPFSVFTLRKFIIESHTALPLLGHDSDNVDESFDVLARSRSLGEFHS